MPTYTYKREDGTLFEAREPITAKPMERCPTTGQKVTRVITAPAHVSFKGPGFYVNDYK